MSIKNTASVDDLVWAREMLRSFASIEKGVREVLGSFGIEKIVLKSPLFIALIIFSVIINALGVYLWLFEQDSIYSFSCLIPVFTAIYIYKTIKEEKSKNILRFVGKSIHISVPTLESVLNVVEKAVFAEKDKFETIIAWRANQISENSEIEKFAHMFEEKTWENIETAQQQCLVLAILKVSLQKFLLNNRETYEEHVKKIPLMNAGYSYKPGKLEAKKLTPEDIQTFCYPTDDK